MDLSALDRALDAKSYGLVALAAAAGDDVRRALWIVLAQCESLYWIGPLAEKPVVPGPARCWLLECPLDGRAAGLQHVLRNDPHAIHVVGVVDHDVMKRLVDAALVGCVVVAEVEATSASGAVDAVRALGVVDDTILQAALVGGVGPAGDVTIVRG